MAGLWDLMSGVPYSINAMICMEPVAPKMGMLQFHLTSLLKDNLDRWDAQVWKDAKVPML